MTRQMIWKHTLFPTQPAGKRGDVLADDATCGGERKGQHVGDALGHYWNDESVRVSHSLQMSVKLTKEVFLVPTRTT